MRFPDLEPNGAVSVQSSPDVHGFAAALQAMRIAIAEALRRTFTRRVIENEPKAGRLVAGRMLLLLASLVILVAGLRAAQNFFLPVLLAFFVATVSFPITRTLTRRKVPRSLAVLLTVLVDFAFIAGVVLLGVVLMQDLQAKWNAKYAAQLYQQVRDASQVLAANLAQLGVEDAQEKIRIAVESNLASLQQIRFERIWNFGTGVLGQVVGFFGAAVIFIILTVFMLSEAEGFGGRLQAISQAQGPNIARMVSATRDIQRYLAIKTVVSLATGFLAGLLCWAAGLDFFILWGIVAFALNFIPVIGSIIAGVPPTILALLVAGVPNALLVAGGYLLINNFLGNFLEPILVGRRFGISTLVVVISVMFWGWVWGPLGMLLAVPLTMVLKVILDGSDEFRWIGVAIGTDYPRGPTDTRHLEFPPKEDAHPGAQPQNSAGA
ncbi:MAG: AI-2E family transporter [Verrucomicrobiaceae bacterium]|nr:MAG: AI-2E family transporter [Verrucomicrobiaceae bacterium]